MHRSEGLLLPGYLFFNHLLLGWSVISSMTILDETPSTVLSASLARFRSASVSQRSEDILRRHSHRQRLSGDDGQRKPLYGRSSELEQLALRRPICLVHGRSGSGKTRLVESFFDTTRSNEQEAAFLKDGASDVFCSGKFDQYSQQENHLTNSVKVY